MLKNEVQDKVCSFEIKDEVRDMMILLTWISFWSTCWMEDGMYENSLKRKFPSKLNWLKTSPFSAHFSDFLLASCTLYTDVYCIHCSERGSFESVKSLMTEWKLLFLLLWTFMATLLCTISLHKTKINFSIIQ